MKGFNDRSASASSGPQFATPAATFFGTPESKITNSFTVQQQTDEKIKELKEKEKSTSKTRRSEVELFDGNIAIGERHSDISPKKFMVENMAFFKDQGFKTIFLEHIPMTLQDDLNTYFNSEENKFSTELSRKLDKLNEGHMDFDHIYFEDEALEAKYRSFYYGMSDSFNFKTIISAAKENGINIIALEESAEIYKNISSGTARMSHLNSKIKEIVESVTSDYNATNPPLKYIVFVGSAHLNKNEGVPGICDVIDNLQDFSIGDHYHSQEREFFVCDGNNPILISQIMGTEALIEERKDNVAKTIDFPVDDDIKSPASEKKEKTSVEEEIKFCAALYVDPRKSLKYPEIIRNISRELTTDEERHYQQEKKASALLFPSISERSNKDEEFEAAAYRFEDLGFSVDASDSEFFPDLEEDALLSPLKRRDTKNTPVKAARAVQLQTTNNSKDI